MSTSREKSPKGTRSPKDDISTSGNNKGKGVAIEFNYDKLNASNSYISVPSGRAPYFDGTHYVAWRHKIKLHLISLHPSIWKIVCTSCDLPNEDKEFTPEQEQSIHRNA